MRASSVRASRRGVTVRPDTKAAASSTLNTPISLIKSRVSTSTVTGNFARSWLVRLPSNVEVAFHGLSFVLFTSKGDNSTTSFVLDASVVGLLALWAQSVAAELAKQRNTAEAVIWARKDFFILCWALNTTIKTILRISGKVFHINR